MCIAKPGREYFEIASVGIGPDNHALVRVFPFPAVWPHAVEADVADAPINPSVGALDQARHAMAAKANMYAVSMGDRFFEIGQTVPVAILYAPHIRTNADKKIIPVGQYGAGHIGDFIMKEIGRAHV